VIKLSIAALNMGQTVISFSDCKVYARTAAESVPIAVKTSTAIATSSPNQVPPATMWSSSTVLRRRLPSRQLRCRVAGRVAGFAWASALIVVDRPCW
jgi:hypothetical protein